MSAKPIPGFIQVTSIGSENTILIPVREISRVSASTIHLLSEDYTISVKENSEEIANQLRAAQQPPSHLTPELFDFISSLVKSFKISKEMKEISQPNSIL